MRYFHWRGLERKMEKLNKFFKSYNLNEIDLLDGDFRVVRVNKDILDASFISELQAAQRNLLPFPPEGRYSEYLDEIERRVYENDEELIKILKIIFVVSSVGRSKIPGLKNQCPSVPLGMLAYDRPLTDWHIDWHEYGKIFSPVLYWQNYGIFLYLVKVVQKEREEEFDKFLQNNEEKFLDLPSKWDSSIVKLYKNFKLDSDIITEKFFKGSMPHAYKMFFLHQINGTWKYEQASPETTIIHPFRYGETTCLYDFISENKGYLDYSSNKNNFNEQIFLSKLGEILDCTDIDTKMFLTEIKKTKAYQQAYGVSMDV